ncbi:hypothetical protein [Fuscibacter oryzae]|uniref:Uncharacterized protein n=1 Tax=Fuscibacter oryzae TaxID=2803939 RepID=A0A8J7MUW5_9RHOB|nr:hypothetical protein [Fuscibacter oryzae]MBL4928913.1 hypothetical protein [Fuscibacter oryzae]
MQALLAPIVASGGAMTAASILPGVAGAASAVDGYSAALAEKRRAEANAYIGRTRAVQTNVNAREGLNEELATMRATFATNAQKPGVGTMEVFDELRRVRSRERRVEFGNQMAQAADWKMAAKKAGVSSFGALLGGLKSINQSLFDLSEIKRVQNLEKQEQGKYGL